MLLCGTVTYILEILSLHLTWEFAFNMFVYFLKLQMSIFFVGVGGLKTHKAPY